MVRVKAPFQYLNIYVVVKPSEVVLAGYEYCYHATISGIYGCGFQAQHDACRRQFVISSYLNGTYQIADRTNGRAFLLPRQPP